MALFCLRSEMGLHARREIIQSLSCQVKSESAGARRTLGRIVKASILCVPKSRMAHCQGLKQYHTVTLSASLSQHSTPQTSADSPNRQTEETAELPS